MKHVSSFLVVTLLWLDACSAARILAIFGSLTPSHYAMYGSVVRALVKRGHHLTVVSHFPEKMNMENLTEISLMNSMENPLLTIRELQQMTYIDNIHDLVYYTLMACETILEHPAMQDVLSSGHHDIYLTEIFGSDCFLPIGHKMGLPSVGLISSVSLPWVSQMVAHPDNPSYNPLYFLPFTQRMSFGERVINTVLTVYSNYFYETVSNYMSQELAEKLLGPLPPMRDIARNYSLILANSHYSINQVKATVPQIVEVGGLHIPKVIPPIPKDLNDFANGAEHGLILFSLGSLVPAETICEEKMKDIMEVLGALPQRILWKINGTSIPTLKLPSNIKTSDWVPQLSILCHPSTKLFIGHGGLLGVQEAVNCAVPMLGVPMFADQSLNIAELSEKGMALLLQYNDINKESLSKAVNSLLNEEKYQRNAKFLSELFKERPMHPLDTAIYWIEYVIKFGGAKHLRSAAHELHWFQYYLLDVALFLLLSISGLLFSACYILLLLYRILKRTFIKPKVLSNSKKES